MLWMALDHRSASHPHKVSCKGVAYNVHVCHAQGWRQAVVLGL